MVDVAGVGVRWSLEFARGHAAFYDGFLPRIALPSGGRIYHPLDLRDLVGWKPAQLGMFVDDFFVLGQIDTKGLVRCDVRLNPLNVRAQLAKRRVRFLRSLSQLFSF